MEFHQLPWANNATAIEDGDIAKQMKPWKADGLTVMVTESVRKTEPSFELYYSSDAPERQAIAVSVSEQAKEMGIEVKAIGSIGINDNKIHVQLSGDSEVLIINNLVRIPQFPAGIGYNNPSYVTTVLLINILTMHLNHVKVHIPNGLMQFGTAVIFHHK